MSHEYPTDEQKASMASEPVAQYDTITPRVCSIQEARQRSMTVEQFTGKLYAMVDDFYSKKA